MKKELLSILKKDAFFKKKIKLSSGKISNYYVDVRRVSLTARGLYLISRLIWKEVEKMKVSALGGPTLGADPIVGGVCVIAAGNKKNLKGFLVRKAPKKHGRQKMIEGPVIKPGSRVAVVDDVATSGGSLIKTIGILRREKINVTAALCVIDRAEGARETLADLKCPLVSLFTKSDFL